jgi:hypothetical protein
VTGQTAAQAKPDRIGSGFGISAGSPAGGKPNRGKESQNMVATMLNPACQHDWFKPEKHLQTLASEGKTIWRCRICAEVTNTYDWQKP